MNENTLNGYRLVQNILEANTNGNGFLVGNKLSYVDILNKDIRVTILF